jgi:hypothetical protein
VGEPARHDSTPPLLRLLLFFAGILPGLIHGIWKDMTGAELQCPKCESRALLRGSSTVSWGTIAGIAIFATLALVIILSAALR